MATKQTTTSKQSKAMQDRLAKKYVDQSAVSSFNWRPLLVLFASCYVIQLLP